MLDMFISAIFGAILYIILERWLLTRRDADEAKSGAPVRKR
jgi:hypothetical protein